MCALSSPGSHVATVTGGSVLLVRTSAVGPKPNPTAAPQPDDAAGAPPPRNAATTTLLVPPITHPSLRAVRLRASRLRPPCAHHALHAHEN